MATGDRINQSARRTDQWRDTCIETAIVVAGAVSWYLIMHPMTHVSRRSGGEKVGVVETSPQVEQPGGS